MTYNTENINAKWTFQGSAVLSSGATFTVCVVDRLVTAATRDSDGELCAPVLTSSDAFEMACLLNAADRNIGRIR